MGFLASIINNKRNLWFDITPPPQSEKPCRTKGVGLLGSYELSEKKED